MSGKFLSLTHSQWELVKNLSLNSHYAKLERVWIYHGYGIPKNCLKDILAKKGYDAKTLRIFLRSKGIRPVISKRKWKVRKQSPGKKIPSSKSRW